MFYNLSNVTTEMLNVSKQYKKYHCSFHCYQDFSWNIALKKITRQRKNIGFNMIFRQSLPRCHGNVLWIWIFLDFCFYWIQRPSHVWPWEQNITIVNTNKPIIILDLNLKLLSKNESPVTLLITSYYNFISSSSPFRRFWVHSLQNRWNSSTTTLDFMESG